MNEKLKREQALDELTKLSQEMGMYDMHPWEQYEKNQHAWEKRADSLKCDFCELILDRCSCN